MVGSSLSQNPPNAGRHLTSGGSDWLWAVFAIMALATLGMVAWSSRRLRGTRLFHNIALVILTTSTIAYFAMASDLGATPVTTEFGFRQTRQIFFVRYIQWFITFPLLLIMLLYTSGLALSDILTTAFFAWVVVVCGLVGALTVSRYKWGFFVLGLAALCYIWSSLLGHGPRTAFNAGSGIRSGYIRGAAFVALVTMLYPVAWGLSEGGNRLSVTGEMIFYGILDLLLGPVFLYYFVWGLRNVDYGLWGFHSGKFSDGQYGTNGAGVGAGRGVGGAGYGDKSGVGAGTGAGTGHGLGTGHGHGVGVGNNAGGLGNTGAGHNAGGLGNNGGMGNNGVGSAVV